MFDMRRSEDAEGERRMMGSGRRAGALGLWERGALLAAFAAAAWAALRVLNGAASFLTCEKSCFKCQNSIHHNKCRWKRGGILWA
jgi:hypothetical protein